MKLTSCFFLSNLSLLIKDILLEINQKNIHNINQQKTLDENANRHQKSLYERLQEKQAKWLEDFASLTSMLKYFTEFIPEENN